MKNSIDKSEKNKPLTTLCGKSNKLTVELKSLSETKKLMMVMMLTTELSPITPHALTLLPELKSVLKPTSETKPIPNLPLLLLLTSEIDNMKLSLLNKTDTTSL